MGDIGGVAQAGASVADTAMTNAANVALQQSAQSFNANQAAVQRSWSADQAQKQMDFNAAQAQNTRVYQTGEREAAQAYNTEMSDTQIQRRMADLKAAGVNPLLAASQLGGASSPVSQGMSGATASAGLPSGSTASAPGVAHVQGLLQNAANLALTNAQTSKAAQDARTGVQTEEFTKQQARAKQFEGDILAVDSSDASLMARGQYLQEKYAMAADQAAIVAQTRQLVVKQTAYQDLDNTNLQIKNAIDNLDLKGQRALFDQMLQVQRAVMDQTGAEAENIAAVQRGAQSPYGKAATAIAYAQSLHQPISSAVGAAGRAMSGPPPPAQVPPGALPSPGYAPFDRSLSQ